MHIAYMGWNVYELPLQPGYPGHEGVGEVVDGGTSEFEPGDIVLTAPNIWSSRVFAGYQLIDPKFLIRLPGDTPLEHLLMAQQLGTVVYGCKLLPPLLGKTVAIIGQGSVGLFHDFLLRRLGAHRIIAIEPIPGRLTAGVAMGIDEAVDVTGDKATEAVMDLTGGQGADLVIEAVGSPETLNQSMRLAKDQGRIAVFGLPPNMEMAASMSRKDLENNKDFQRHYIAAKERVRKMEVRVVEVAGPIEQTILEVYAHIELGTPFNSFENH